MATAFAAYGSKAHNICQFVTVCAVYASKVLPHTLAKNTILYDFDTACTALAICYRMHSVQVLPYAQCALAICDSMRSVR
jgi:hypothetical protein